MAGPKSKRPTPRPIPRVTPRHMQRFTPRGTPRPPIPREEPDDAEPGGADLPAETMEVQVASYETLREGCRNDEAVDDELAIQAEVARVAIDRSSVRPKK